MNWPFFFTRLLGKQEFFGTNKTFDYHFWFIFANNKIVIYIQNKKTDSKINKNRLKLDFKTRLFFHYLKKLVELLR